MPSTPLHPSSLSSISPTSSSSSSNPLPSILRTPSGYAIVEIQGTINMPPVTPSEPPTGPSAHHTPIGRLIFPDYSPDSLTGSTAWMKRVYLYIGQHQRLTGEVKKLPRPLAVVRKREATGGASAGEADRDGEELEVVEIVKWKVLFASRPEPVGE
jgi:chromosome transmission fidelity protein 8